ncbi:MAG: site-specific integrase [Lactococcus sp.]|nr:site-specific integrase [Lactococcus sp.]
MWIEDLPNEKYKYFERFRDPLTEKWKKVSVTLDKKTPRAQKAAQIELSQKVQKKMLITDSSQKTIKDVYHEWVKKYESTVKESSLRNIRSLWRNADNRIVKGAILKNVTSGIIQQWIDKIYFEENLSYSATDAYRTMLSNIFRYAKLTGYITANPVADVRIDRKKVDQSEKIEEKFLEPNELKAVIDKLNGRSRSKRYGNMMEFISLTGLRFGELVALKYEDYDGKSVSVTKTLDYHYSNLKPTLTSPKNSYSIRNVSLPDRAIELIETVILENKLRKSTGPYVDEGYIFTTMYGTPIFIGNVNKSLRLVKKSLKLEKKLSTHTFRHTHVSQLAELNLPIKSIMARVGHNSPNTTLKIYTHVTKKMETELINQLNKKINGN